jgi:hypothetical protein
LEGNAYNDPGTYDGFTQVAGENAMFWVNLSAAGLIEGTFNTASETTLVENIADQKKVGGRLVYRFTKTFPHRSVCRYTESWRENPGVRS